MRKYDEIDVNLLKPYKKNARVHSDTQVESIAKSITEFGFINPVLVDKDFGVIAGHGRLMAAKKLGMDKVPCLFVEDLTDEQKRAYIIADNKLALDADWDYELLSVELNELDEMGFDTSLTGFDILDFQIEDEQQVDEDDFEAEIPDEPITKLGDIWKLGNHRLMCGDSTSFSDVEKLMNGDKADLLITDPPYNVDYEGKTKDALKIKNDKMEQEQFHNFLCDVFLNAYSFMKDGASFYVWYASREVVNFQTSIEDSGLTVKQELIWNKNSLVMGRQDYQWKHEPCLYGWKETESHSWYGDRKQTTVIDWDRPIKSELHPTMKPVGLFDYQIKNSSKKGDIVLDLFGGSGTTIIACEQNGRNAYSMEFDPKYCDVIVNRWEKLTCRKAELLNV